MRALAQSFGEKEKKTVHKTKNCELGKSERTEWETESWELEEKSVYVVVVVACLKNIFISFFAYNKTLSRINRRKNRCEEKRILVKEKNSVHVRKFTTFTEETGGKS